MMSSISLPSTAAPAAGELEPALQSIAQRFPEDLKVAMATAQALRRGPPNVPAPAQEPWPPMQVPA